MIETPERAVRSLRDRQSSRQLVNRIAVGDRSAFRCLYATFVKRVRQSAMLALPQPLHAQAVTSATFLEVWYLAPHHVNRPPAQLRSWITAVAARRISERVRTLRTPHMLLDDYDRHVHCQLAELLSPARPGAAAAG
jgi:DNA-directed RNA polymerase specialized sigma24 family protein